MEREQLRALLEALIFVADEPITAGALGMVLAQDGVETAAIRQVLEEIIEAFRSHPDRGIEVREVAGGYQFRTKPEMAPWIQRLNVPKPVRLSQAAMETLSIVAYRQPMVRAEIEEIRGVDCGGVLKTLLERNVIRIVGKRDEPGTPLLYGTTQEFLSLFNLRRLEELPTLKDYRELNEQRVSTMATTDEALMVELSHVDGAELAQEEEAIHPIDPERQVQLDAEDHAAVRELEDQIRSLRHLEGAIFPKPEETLTAVEVKPTEEMPEGEGEYTPPQ